MSKSHSFDPASLPVVYHGTGEFFDVFNQDKVGALHADVLRESGSHDHVDPIAFYFTNDPDTAIWYARDSARQLGKPEEDGVVLSVTLLMTNPRMVNFSGTGREYLAEEIEAAKNDGCDGLICWNFDDGGVSDHFIVFSADKINILAAQTCVEFGGDAPGIFNTERASA